LERVSPCIGLCQIDTNAGLCLGCARTVDEISMWGQGPEENRRRVWAELPERRARLGLGLHRLEWTSRDVHSFIAGTLRPGGGTWVSGIYGAVAEFSIGNGEQIDLDISDSVITAATSRGAITFRPTPRIRALAFGSSPDAARADIVVLAIARVHVRIALEDGLTCVGHDAESIKPEGSCETLYDFGLGRASGRFGIRTARPDLLASLRRHQGLRWPMLLASVGNEIQRASPTRVVRSPLGRLEVFTPIPPPAGVSPRGPHTHFLPEQLAVGGDLPPALQIPDAYVPCAIHYPAKASPLRPDETDPTQTRADTDGRGSRCPT